MGKHLLVLAAAAAVLIPAYSARGETVRLKNGNVITGEVLAEKADTVVVDLGWRVLEVPRDEVASVERQATPEGPAVGGGAADTPKEGLLYLTADLKRQGVRELVAAFGQGVVKVQTPKGLGSGFVINKDGHILTNAHVIQGETRISVILFFKEGEALSRRAVTDVEIVAVNPTADLALLKVKPPEGVTLTPLYFGEMDRVRTGEPVFAIGNPFGLERSVSEGIVSHKARHVEDMLLIQTTAPINPGNSGGPLLNMRGEVIGVTNLKFSYFAEGMGFAVPVNYVKDFLGFREAYAYDKDNPNTGYHYLEPPHRAAEQGEKEHGPSHEEPLRDAGEGQ
jgi:serine protease Do